MWNQTIISMVEDDISVDGCEISAFDGGSMRPAKSIHCDALRIRETLVDVFSHDTEKLTSYLSRVDAYLETLVWCIEIEDLADECKRVGISAEHRIVSSGVTLKTAMTEKQKILSASDPFQEFDCVYGETSNS